MIPNTLQHAICEIEEYERSSSANYGTWSEEIAMVKKVMTAVIERLQQPSSGSHLDVAEILSPEQKELWRATCEAEIARWAKLLRLLEPIVGEEIVGKLHDAVQRQDALLERSRQRRHK